MVKLPKNTNKRAIIRFVTRNTRKTVEKVNKVRMKEGLFRSRQRFLSEQIDIKAFDGEKEEPKSPPTPRIEPLQLLDEDELEELELSNGEDFKSESRVTDFAIQFSKTNDEKLQSFTETTKVSESDRFQAKMPKNDFAKNRSKSYGKLPTSYRIYDFLVRKTSGGHANTK